MALPREGRAASRLSEFQNRMLHVSLCLISDCYVPLSSQSFFGDLVMNASSALASKGPEQATLNNSDAAAWTPAASDVKPWLSIMIGRYARLTQIATQGSPSAEEWVKSYTLYYSVDSGQHWMA